jgi:hypothetical protein
MGAISLGQFDKAWSLNPITFAICLALIVWALKITPVYSLARQVSAAFQRRALVLQVLSLTFLYAIAWIAAIERFKSGIL